MGPAGGRRAGWGRAGGRVAAARIAVLRANGIGDLVFALPALDALRDAYPDAVITLLGAPWHVELMNGRPSPVDEVVAVPPHPGIWLPPEGRPDPAQVDQFFAGMQQRAFDMAIQLHGGGGNSNPFVRRLGAKLTVGMATPDAAALDRQVPYLYWQPEILRYLEVVALVGAPVVTVEPQLAVTDADREQAAQVVPVGSRPLAVLNPGATDPRRRWPTAKLARVGDTLAGAGADVVVIGDASDRSRAEAVVLAMSSPARSVAGQLSLAGLAGLLSRAGVTVSNDSGPLHLAGAVGAPTVGIFWCGNLINGGPPTRGRHRVAVSWQLRCPVCERDCMEDPCSHDTSFVAGVEVDEVASAALDLLGQAQGSRGGSPRSRPSAGPSAEPAFSAARAEHPPAGGEEWWAAPGGRPPRGASPPHQSGASP